MWEKGWEVWKVKGGYEVFLLIYQNMKAEQKIPNN
jgi:hypothetical protein